ncbi:MAG: hypothetical protein ACFFCS_14900 [Candidatus Hodarchaeota archaeon]
MNIIEEVKEGLHSRSLNEKHFAKINQAMLELANNTKEGQQIMEEMTEDGDRVVINFDFGPDGKFYWAAEDGKLTVGDGVLREDADGTVFTSAKTWYEALLLFKYPYNEVLEKNLVRWEKKATMVAEFNPLLTFMGETLDMPPGMMDSRVLDLEPMEMVAFHLEGDISIQGAVAGLVDGMKEHAAKIERIFLIHDKRVFHPEQYNSISEKDYGIIAMAPVPEKTSKNNLIKGDLYELSFEGGKHGALDCLLSDLRPRFSAWRHFAWLGFEWKHDVAIDKNKIAMTEIIVNDGIRAAFTSNPRECIENKADDIKAIVYVPLVE